MKLIHTSDWHFGMGVGTGNYEAEQRFFLDRLEELEDTSAAKTEEKGPCCTVCGAEHDAGAMFCVKCGTKL